MKNVMLDIIHFANILPHFAFSSWWVTILEPRVRVLQRNTLTAPSYLGHDSPVPDVVKIVRHIVDHRRPELTEFLARSHPAAADGNWGSYFYNSENL